MERVRRVKLPGGKSLDRKKVYNLVVSPQLIDGATFTLGATDCSSRGCKKPGTLDRWKTTSSDRSGATLLSEYLRRLPQPVTPPDDQRLISSR